MKQKLITNEIIEAAKKYPTYSQEGKGKDAVVLARFFTPRSSFSWYMIEYNVKTGEAFGLTINGEYAEYGNFYPEEMQEMQQEVSAFGIRVKVKAVERDISVQPCKKTLEECLNDYSEMKPSFWSKKEEEVLP